MTDMIDYVAGIARLNGGEIVGKTRLQKIFYLLEEMGLGFNLDFDYHNYGPFSAELAFAVDDARGFGYLETEDRQGYHSVPYTVFRSTELVPDLIEDGRNDDRGVALVVMSSSSALVLELAATAVYLRKQGFADTFWEEVQARKPLKASPERIERAKTLIENLGLEG